MSEEKPKPKPPLIIPATTVIIPKGQQYKEEIRKGITV